MKLVILRDGGFEVRLCFLWMEAVASVRNEKPFYKHGWFSVGWNEDTLLDFGKR